MNKHRIGRNDPCPCGSGKKYKKCCNNKRPRTQSLLVGYKEPFKGVTVKNGEIVAIILPSGERIKPDALFTQTDYTRKNGREKVLNIIPDIATINTTLYLASEFRGIFAIDTNTKQVGNDRIAAGVVFECYGKMIDRGKFEFSYRKCIAFVFKNCPNGLEEKYSWARLINTLTTSPKYNKNFRIAIVTDHDKDNHSRYNARELPIIKSFYLPENFTLLYASSDAGRENIMNILIGKCENEAKNILASLEKGESVAIGDSTIFSDKISTPNLDGF